MRNILIALALIFASTVALAGPVVSVDLEAKTDNLYRGEIISDDHVTVLGTVRVSDLGLPGLYVRGTVDSIDSSRLSSINLRADAGVGLAHTWAGVTADASFNRVFNPALQSDDFNEARLSLATDWRLLNTVDFFAELNRALTEVQHWYGSAGVLLSDVVISGLDLRLGASYYQFQDQSSFQLDRNNFELGAAFRVTDQIAVFATHSRGGLGFSGQELGNHTLAGVRFSL